MAKNFTPVSKYQGVYFRESEAKRFQGKPDKCFYVTYKDHQGKKVWEKVGWVSEGYTAQNAQHIRGERLRTIRHGEELPRRKAKEANFEDVWQRYEEWLETNKKRPKDDRFLYQKHLKARFADKALSKISPFDLERMKIELLKEGYAPATAKHCLVLVRQMFNKAAAWGLWQGENPIKQVKMPRLNNRRERFLSPEEAHQLLGWLDTISPQLHDMALLSLHTGMRAGEIFALKWGHIDLENGLIHIADPKGGEARKAFLTPSIKTMLQERNRDGNHREEQVFKSRKGEQILEVSNAFAGAVSRLGYNDGIEDPRQKVTFHTLRHTFASWLALKGTPILTIKELLGHKSLAMTERYSHLIPDHKRDAVQSIEEYFHKTAEQPKSVSKRSVRTPAT